jgi:putative phosphoesterase
MNSIIARKKKILMLKQKIIQKQENAQTKVGLISDTHIPVYAKEIPKRVLKVFEKVDYIIHAGDLVDLSVIDRLERIAPVVAVHGNMDGPEIRSRLPEINSLKVFDWKIGVMHDPGIFLGMGKMCEIARQNGFNVLVYGHTHRANIKWEGEILLINPGSPTSPIPPFITKPTIGLLRVTMEKVLPEIITLS